MAVDYGQAVHGLFSAGTGYLTAEQARREEEKRRLAAAGGFAGQMTGAAQTALSQAGTMDPNALAAQEFAKSQAIQQPGKDKELADLMRILRAKGMLGAGNYQGAAVNPMTGQTETFAQTPGQAVNPQMAAFFAARRGQESKEAAGALDRGQAYLDKLLGRSREQATAGRAQEGAQLARQAPAKSNFLGQLAPAAGGILQSSGLFGKIGEGIAGLFKRDDYTSSLFDSFRGGTYDTDWSTAFGD